MTQPTRWLEDNDVPSEIRELILAGSRPPRFPKVALAAAIIPMAQKAAMAGTWSLPATAIVAAKATSVGLAIGLGSLAAVTMISGSDGTKSHNVRVAPERPVAPIQQRQVAIATVALEQPVGSVEPTAEAAAPVERPATNLVGSANAAGPSARPIGIAAEAQLLEHARSLLNESPARSLLLTNEHRDRFASGQMSAERELIAIDALLRLGRAREAQLRAQPLLADGASHIFAQRVRNLLVQHGQK